MPDPMSDPMSGPRAAPAVADEHAFRPVDVGRLPAFPKAPGGAAPHLGWVDIDRLVIDEAYQRPLTEGSWRAIRKIAERFDWNLFSVVDVSPVGEGRYAIVDGQHRTHAAAAIGIAKVPCRICLADRAGQARAFAAINGEVTAITPFHIFKAALAAGETWAIAAECLCRDAGCRLMTTNMSASAKRPRQVFAVTFVRAIVERNAQARNALSVALAALAGSGAGDDVEAWSFQVLRAWYGAVFQLDDWIEKPNAARALSRFLDRDVSLTGVMDDAVLRARAARRTGEATAPPYQLATGRLSLALDERFPDLVSFVRSGE